MDVILMISVYFIVLTILGFASMGLDKWKAIHRAWRIPEATLFAIAILGGSVGSIAGMHFFRHKTKHWYFLYGMPVILLIQIIIAVYIISSGKFIIMW